MNCYEWNTSKAYLMNNLRCTRYFAWYFYMHTNYQICETQTKIFWLHLAVRPPRMDVQAVSHPE